MTQSGFLRLSMNPQIVGVALDFSAARALLAQLVEHADHHFFDRAPALEGEEFETIGALVRGYRQISDATLIYLARVHGLQVVTFDQALASVCPWPECVLVLTSARTGT